jgi:hypothetical protein
VTGLTSRLAGHFDRLYAPERRDLFRRITVYLALAGLVFHSALILLGNTLAPPPQIVAAVGTNFLSALYTPFSFILFYEVLLLILSIPESTTRSLGRQYEILSLVVIRNVFKDIAEFESLDTLENDWPEFMAVLLDMGGGLIMFALVGAFYYVNNRRPARPQPSPEEREKVRVFVERKKVIALFLSVLLYSLALFSLGAWLLEVVGVAQGSALPTIDIKKIFYVDLFTVLIFSDAVLLLLSLLLQDRYHLVFRNAAFVVSTILMRFSLAAPKPYDVELGIGSIAFGTLVVLVYNYFLRIEAGEGDSTKGSPPA